MIFYVVKRKGRRLWRGRYRIDKRAKITEVPLDTTDKQDAQQKLREIVAEQIQVRAGIIPPKKLLDAAQSDLKKHLDDYIRDLEKLGRDADYTYNVDKLVGRLITECEWTRLADVTADSFQQWRRNQEKAPKTLNEYLASVSSFLNWLVRQRRLLANPLLAAERVETRGRERRKRRASTEVELRRLLLAAGPRRPVYLFALLTGLRRAEIAALVWSDVFLEAAKPFIKVRAATTKNHLDATIWLHSDLIAVLSAIRLKDAAADDPVFPCVPSMYLFKKDLAVAGIPYKDKLGRLADFHSLRHTFGTNLSLAGVLPRVAMELMRHSDLRLTMKVYTDATQLPSADGIDRLPSLIGSGPQIGPQGLGAESHEESRPVTAPGDDSAGEASGRQ